MRRSVLLVLVVGVVAGAQHARPTYKKYTTPPHCTHLSKDTDYNSKYKYDYPIAYIPPGQQEAYQQLYCIQPPTVNKAVSVVCDWGAPPQVQFALGDEYVHVVRRDPAGHFVGSAVITTYQLCSHSLLQQNATVYVSAL